jgi:metal-dependent hydrolase (beta-lactamase superfamily II)
VALKIVRKKKAKLPVKYYCIIISIFIVLNVPRPVWAEENFFQIINDSGPAVNEDFTLDRGYSVYVSFDGKRFLMDTGINKISLAKNLQAAGISLEDLDFVLLSHPHRDHISGLSYIRKERPSLSVYVPSGGGFKFLGPKGIIEVDDHLRMSSNIFLIHTYDELGSVHITDELSLLLLTKKGPYLFTTNSHTDFFLKLEKAKHLAGMDVFFHSGHTARRVSSKDLITTHANKLKALKVTQVSPSHSSSSHNKIFEEVFGANYVAAVVGRKVPLEPVSN